MKQDSYNKKDTGVLFSAIVIALLGASSACVKSKSGSGLRSYDAPFTAATLQVTGGDWQILLGDAGTETRFTVSGIVEVVSSEAVAGLNPQSQESGTNKVLTFSPGNASYTYKFNVKETARETTAVCWTTYPAAIGYTVNSPFLKCDKNLNEQPEESTPPQQDDNWDQQIAAQVVSSRQEIAFVLSYFGEQIDVDTRSTWYAVENDVKDFIRNQYSGDASTAIEELAAKVSSHNLKIVVDYNFAQTLNDIYKTAAPPPVVKKCVCTVSLCPTGDTPTCQEPTTEIIPTATTQSACEALDGTEEFYNVDFNQKFIRCSFQ